MPTYEYQCESCNQISDGFYSIADKPDEIPCRYCLEPAHFIISKPMVLVDSAQDIPWLSDFASKRKEARFGHKPIETRTEYKRYLKENDLRPTDGDNLTEI